MRGGGRAGSSTARGGAVSRGGSASRGSASSTARGGASSTSKMTDNLDSTKALVNVCLFESKQGTSVHHYVLEAKLRDEEDENKIDSTLSWRNIENLSNENVRVFPRNILFLKRSIRRWLNETFEAENAFIWDGAATVQSFKHFDVNQQTQVEKGKFIFDVRIRLTKGGGLNQSENSNVSAQRTIATHLIHNAALAFTENSGGFYDKLRETYVIVHDQPGVRSEISAICRNSLNSSTFNDMDDKAKARHTTAMQAIKGNSPEPCLKFYRSFAMRVSPYKNDVESTFAVEILPKTTLFIHQDINLCKFLKECPIFSNEGNNMSLAKNLASSKDFFDGLLIARDLTKYENPNNNPDLLSIGSIRGISQSTALEHVITLKATGDEISVAQYFEKKGMALKHPELPLIRVIFQSDRKKAPNRRFGIQEIPAEFLVLKSQGLNVMDPKLQNHTTPICKMTPILTRSLVLGFYKAFINSDIVKSYFDTWGIKPSINNPENFSQGLLLSPIYKCNAVPVFKDMKPIQKNNKGSWNLRDALFVEPLKVTKRKVIAIDLSLTDFATFKSFILHFTSAIEAVGVQMKCRDYVTKDSIIPLFDEADYAQKHKILKNFTNGDEIRANVISFVNKKMEELLSQSKSGANVAWNEKLFGALIILGTENGMNDFIYYPLKMYFEGQKGISTQCCQARTFSLNKTIDFDGNKFKELSNLLALSVSSKFGMTSVNQKVKSKHIDRLGPNTLVIGGDLAHGNCRIQEDDSRKVQTAYSTAALVVSHSNSDYIRYDHSGRLQRKPDKHVDIMHNTGAILEDSIQNIINTNNQKNLVDNAIYFRDGTDPASYEKIIEQEIGPMVDVLKNHSSPDSNNNFKFSCLAIMKRHNLRAFPPVNDASSTFVTPGSAFGFEDLQKDTKYQTFYMLGHVAVGNATAIPYKVAILRNDHNYTVQEWAEICHGFGLINQVVTGPISLPVPVYYAHKFADLLANYQRFLPRSNKVYDVVSLNEEVVKMIKNVPQHCYL